MATRERIRDLLDKMTEERTRLLLVVQSLSDDEALFVPANAEGEAQWTAKEQLAHLVSMEVSYRAWVERAIEEDEPDVSGLTGDLPAISVQDANSHSLAEHVAELELQRQTTLRIIAMLSPEDYERRASHRLFGNLTIMQWLRSYYRHDRMHIDQISGRDPEYKPRWAAGMSEPKQQEGIRS